MTNPVKLASSFLDHFPRSLTMPYFVLPHPLTKNPSNMSCLKMKYGKCLNMSSAKDPLILVARRRIYKNISMICTTSIQNIWNLLSTYQPSSIRTLSSPNRMSTQNSSLSKFLPKTWPDKVFPLYRQQILRFTSFSTSMWSFSSI